MKYTPDLYLITPLTNLHAGSGDTTYGIVDKEVQRDAITGIPVIHSSSLKGAVRERLADIFKDAPDEKGRKGHKHKTVEYIFGKYIKGQDAEEALATGNYLFFESKMLALPVRSNRRPYFIATSPGVLSEFFQDLENFGVVTNGLKAAWDKVVKKDFIEKPGNPLLRKDEGTTGLVVEEFDQFDSNQDEDWENFLGKMTEAGLLPKEVILFNNVDIKEICERLPVIARNNLENGISTNLWYEEVVPRQSRFYTFILHPDGHDELAGNLPENKIIQVGGNATVGYGQCFFGRVSLTTKNEES